MPDRNAILQAIYRAVDSLNEDCEENPKIGKSPETRLYGSQSGVDSLRLVGLVIALEQELCDTFGVVVTLADDRALSMTSSPFKSIASLAEYCDMLLKEDHGA